MFYKHFIKRFKPLERKKSVLMKTTVIGASLYHLSKHISPQSKSAKINYQESVASESCNLLLGPGVTTLKTKSLQPLKTFACVSLRYKKYPWWGVCVCVAIVVVVCGEMCGKIEKLSDWNKNWCGSRY